MISPADLRLKYAVRSTGEVVWLIGGTARPALIGTTAGYPKRSRGKTYWMVDIGGTPRKQVMRSRVVFCLTHGRWPIHEVDHINGNSLDDRPGNLREATHAQNVRNVKHHTKASPLPMGIRQLKSGRFFTRIQCGGNRITIGTFRTIADATAAYNHARRAMFGEFA